MDHEKWNDIRIYHEKGILDKTGAGFQSPVDFALQNLIYVLWSNQYVCTSQYSVTRDYLSCYSMIYVIGGEMLFAYDGREYHLKEDQAIMLDLRRPHFYRAVSGRMVKWEMLFNGGVAGAYYQLMKENDAICFNVQGRTKQLVSQIMEKCAESPQNDHELSCMITNLMYLVCFSNLPERSPQIRAAISFIEENFGESVRTMMWPRMST